MDWPWVRFRGKIYDGDGAGDDGAGGDGDEA